MQNIGKIVEMKRETACPLDYCLAIFSAPTVDHHLQFHDYIKHFEPRDVRRALIDLFRVLNTKIADLDPYMDEVLVAFPYVSGGMHYTSIENIQKVIDPLFFDELQQELDEILQTHIERTRNKKLKDIREKLGFLEMIMQSLIQNRGIIE